jgi:erythromycin esterase-like protein/orotate phosphoribosyltransferase
MPARVFRDRREAGRVLTQRLEHYRDRPDVLVVALPRGGVPVAYEVASALRSPLDVFVVRKLGVPGHEELAMGAIASGGVLVIEDDVVRGLRITEDAIKPVAERQARELHRREELYRNGRDGLDVRGKVVILVDDGLATGSSMRAAVRALRRLRPARIVVAVPAAPASTCEELAVEVDEVVCATTPSPFSAVGESYWDFSQTTDGEVRELLRAAAASAQDIDARRPRNPEHVVRAARVPLEADPLLAAVGAAHLVLIGEASHGTHEFYAERARLTQRLIEDHGFGAVAIEGDWPDAYRVNRYVRATGEDASAEEALRGFERFPTWMWRNAVVLEFVGWLREHNDRVAADGGAPAHGAKAGFYGLDLYSLYRSIGEVIAYLDRIDPAAASRARARYACFDHYNDDAQSYGFAAAFGAGKSCEREVVEQLVDLQRHAVEYARHNGLLAEDDHFYAQQNAIAVKNAEEYYRMMFGGRVSSWNLRDRHMAATLDALVEHLSRRRGEPAKVVVWEHNSHIGDARATELADQGELNVGQLVRERHADDCVLAGFTTFGGTVTAADDWDGPAERMPVRPALPGSVETLFHDVGEDFALDLRIPSDAADTFRTAYLERAIGVIYRPRTERQSHYIRARIAEQFDVMMHLDDTRAVEPLERGAKWTDAEAPETYPSAL